MAAFLLYLSINYSFSNIFFSKKNHASYQVLRLLYFDKIAILALHTFCYISFCFYTVIVISVIYDIGDILWLAGVSGCVGYLYSYKRIRVYT